MSDRDLRRDAQSLLRRLDERVRTIERKQPNTQTTLNAIVAALNAAGITVTVSDTPDDTDT